MLGEVVASLPAEDMGDFIRITGYSEHRLSNDEEPVRVIVLRCVWPKAAYLAARKIVDSGIREPSTALVVVK